MTTINTVYSVQEDSIDPTALIISANVTDSEQTYDCVYCTRPSGGGGLNKSFQDWLVDNEGQYTVIPYEAPEVVITQQKPYLWAVAYDLGVNNGEITGMEASTQFGGAIYLDVGTYMVFFLEALPNTKYYPKVYDDFVRMKVTEKYEDYFIVSSWDQEGNLTDPETFNIEIIRLD